MWDSKQGFEVDTNYPLDYRAKYYNALYFNGWSQCKIKTRGLRFKPHSSQKRCSYFEGNVNVLDKELVSFQSSLLVKIPTKMYS